MFRIIVLLFSVLCLVSCHKKEEADCSGLLPAGSYNFVAENQKGQRIQRQNWEQDRRWRLLFFGYTYCPTICPAAMVVMNQIVRSVEGLEGVFISVDPENDTVERLGIFLQPPMQGLRGSQKDMRALISHFHVYSADVPEDDGNIPHTGHLFLIDPDLRLQALFGAPLEADLLIQEIQQKISDHQSCQ
jgi:protein SCO1